MALLASLGKGCTGRWTFTPHEDGGLFGLGAVEVHTPRKVPHTAPGWENGGGDPELHDLNRGSVEQAGTTLGAILRTTLTAVIEAWCEAIGVGSNAPPTARALGASPQVGGLIVDSGHTPLWLSPRRDCFRPFPVAELLPALTSEHQQLDDAAEVVVSGGKPDLDQLGLAPNARACSASGA